MFKKLMQRFGIGGPSVDTVLTSGEIQPGGMLTGHVNITGGDHETNIEGVVLQLITSAEAEMGDSEHSAKLEMGRLHVAGAFDLPAGSQHSIPFQMPIPWETPVTHVHGNAVPGMFIGLRTELAVAGAVDKGDLDPVAVHPLPSQQAVLDAFSRLGFHIKNADIEIGRLSGVHHELHGYQEIEFYPPHTYAGRVGETELTFVANASELTVILEVDGAHHGDDAFGRFQANHHESVNWDERIGGWLNQIAQHGYHGDNHHHYHEESHGGSGIGGALLGAGVGFAAGMVLDDVIEDIFEGDEEED